MKTFVLCAFVAILSPVQAEFRTFTDTKERTLDAELIKADDSQAWLRLKGGRIVTIKRDTLSEADQTFISTWIADILPDVRVTPDFDRGLSRDRDKKSTAVKQTFDMRVEIKNFSATKKLEESEIIYYLIGRSIWDEDQYKVLSRQVVELSIDPSETKKAIFKGIENHYQDIERLRNGNKKGRGHRALGYVLQIQRKRDMRLVHLESPTALLDQFKEAIISLEEGDETDKTFVKKVPEPKIVEKPEAKKPEVITIK